ncbi:MAG: hypothetical protein ACJA2G_002558 [Cognaticolwellia sp.]|jgi:hypothetical protein
MKYHLFNIRVHPDGMKNFKSDDTFFEQIVKDCASETDLEKQRLVLGKSQNTIIKLALDLKKIEEILITSLMNAVLIFSKKLT